MLNMDILPYLAMGIVFLFILYMYVFTIRLCLSLHKVNPKAKMTYRTWAEATVKVTLFWGVMLLVETFWWFWPEGIAHQIAMVLGGIFCVYWGLVYLFIPRR